MTKLNSYLTIKEAAEYLGVSPNTLRNWGRENKVSMHRNPINGYRIFKVADLDEVLKMASNPSSPERQSPRV